MLKKESFVESSMKFNLLLDFFERLFKVFLLFPQKFLTTFLRSVHFEKIKKIYSQWNIHKDVLLAPKDLQLLYVNEFGAGYCLSKK